MTLDDAMPGQTYRGRRVLVTGAGGSIGSELCRQVAALGPSELLLLDIDETAIFLLLDEINWRFPGVPVAGRVADIRCESRINAIFGLFAPEVVLHAAAYKHVPMMEENAGEAVSNNVGGTLNVARSAGRHGVRIFVMLSSDKAVNPTSVMGATKRIAELVVRQQAELFPDTRYASVRFGNVSDSRGSVLPTFRRQIDRGGPVTVTHPEVTRYFITIPEAARLVLMAGCQGSRGDIFMLDMGEAVKIVDLARRMILESGRTDIELIFTGLRPGEKLYEEYLVSRPEAIATSTAGLYVHRTELRDFETFSRQLDELLAVAGSSGTDEIRCMLAGMDIGLRDPDTGGAD